jgi:hypothetical protein
MKALADGRLFRYCVGLVLCLVALVLPYRPRGAYNRFLSFVIHTPFVLFGFLARFLLRRLSLLPEAHEK